MGEEVFENAMHLVNLEWDHCEHELRIEMEERAVDVAGTERDPVLVTILLSLEGTSVTSSSCSSHIKRLDAREASLR